MPPTRLPRKKDVAVALLEQSSVFVHLDPRAQRVSVPTWFKKQPQLVLQIGLNMAIPIPDLRVDEEGLSCTLSFNRSPHYCVVPWSSVYALVGEDGRGMVWPDDVPPEVAAQMQQKTAPKPKLAAVGQGAAEKQPPKKAAASAGEKKAPEPPPAEPPAAVQAEEAPAGDEPKAPAKKKRTRKKAEKAAKAEPAKPLAPVASEPAEAQQEPLARGGAKGKRELPPYLRVIK